MSTPERAMNLDDIVSKLDHVRKSGDGWSARCPSHDDKNNSLSVRQVNGKVLIKCHTGCTFEQVILALRSDNGHRSNGTGAPERPGFDFTDGQVIRLAEALIDEWKVGGPVAAFLTTRGITRETSLLLRFGATERFFQKTGNSAALAIPLYTDGELVGVKYRSVLQKDFLTETGSKMSGLYGTPDPDAKEILLLEGPLDVALATSHGFNAVGIQSAEVTPSKTDLSLLGRHPSIFVIGDADRAGREAMNRWQTELTADYRQALIRVRLGGAKDIGELYADDPTKFKANLTAILRRARAGRDYFELNDLFSESELQSATVREKHAVAQLVPRFEITMPYGEEKSGKSLLVTYIGKCVANGVPVFGKYATTKMPVLYLDLENAHSELDANARWFSGLGPERLRYRTRETGVPALDSPGLVRFCEKHRPLLVLDSQTKFAKMYFDTACAGKGSQFDPDNMSGFFDQLLNLCAAGATIIIIHHAARADAERYANSHQIGANVSRAFAVVSEDRPALHRVRLEGKLFRGASPVSENLIGFPAIAEQGAFGLSGEVPFAAEIDALLDFVRQQPGQECIKETIKHRRGKRASDNLQILTLALERGLLVKNGRKISFPTSGTAGNSLLISDSGNGRER
jgi:hypothetical protein